VRVTFVRGRLRVVSGSPSWFPVVVEGSRVRGGRVLGVVVDDSEVDEDVVSPLMSLVMGALVLVIVPVVVDADIPDFVVVADADGGM
jgi:hypothetical protein